VKIARRAVIGLTFPQTWKAAGTQAARPIQLSVYVWRVTAARLAARSRPTSSRDDRMGDRWFITKKEKGSSVIDEDFGKGPKWCRQRAIEIGGRRAFSNSAVLGSRVNTIFLNLNYSGYPGLRGPEVLIECDLDKLIANIWK